MASDLIGRQLGSYRVEELIEHGGLVEVYRGYHVEIEGQVAIKVIGRDLESDPLLNERFRQEGKIFAQLRHANIAPVYDFGEEGGGHYVVSELIEGITLGQLIDQVTTGQRIIDKDDINFIVRQLAAAIDYAHSQGAVHHDINPSIIHVKPNGQTLLTDFGLVILKARDTVSPTGGTVLLGTPEYMAPEQATDPGRETARSDIYSLGAVIFHLLTGSSPFSADTPVEMTLKHINQPPPAVHDLNPTLPRAVSAVIQTAMAKDPHDRFDKAMGFANALTQAWHVDDLDDVEVLKSGALKRVGDPEPMPTPDQPSGPDATAARRAAPGQRQAERAPRRKRRVSPLVVVALAIALLVLAGVVIGRAVGFDVSGRLRTMLGRGEPAAEEELVITTPTQSPSDLTSGGPLEPAGVRATPTEAPVVTVVPDEAPIATPVPFNIPPLEVGTQALRLVDASVMVYVPEGTFLMGTDDLSRPARERPLHEVLLGGYWIDQTEVTNLQYRQCVDAAACPFPTSTRNYDDPRYRDFPVAFVTWDAASAYCAYVGRAMALDVRLPTEAQWEKAASWDPVTQTKRTYPWGEEFPTPERMRYVESITVFQGAEVGTHPDGASAYGVYDLAGNMAEFVFDHSSEDYYSLTEAAVDPQGPAEGSGRVIRGGSWAQAGTFAVTSRRTVVEAETNGEEIGFRCATNATLITQDNNVAFTPQEALGGAQAAVALALAQGDGDQVTLNEWQAALISLDARLESGDRENVQLEIENRLQALDGLVQAGIIPGGTALQVRNGLRWVSAQLEAAPAAAAAPEVAAPEEPSPTPDPAILTPDPETGAVG